MADPQTLPETHPDGHPDARAVPGAPDTPARRDARRGPPPGRPWYRRPFVLAGLAIVLIVAAVLGGRYWAFARAHESTDDAFIEGEIIRISPQVSGHVARVLVTDNQEVQTGQLLVQIDERQYRAAVEQARAQAVAAEAAARRAHTDARRAQQLFDRQLIARAALDEALANERATAGQLEAASAEVARRELDLQYTRIVAPENGHVTRKTVEEGMFVQVGQPLMAIVTRDLWVVANFKETQVGKIRPGQRVEIRVDAYRGKVFRGHVDSIQRGSGARFSLLPPENATGNYVKVVQRVPVKIVFDEAPDPQHPLGPGMSVVPSVKIS